MINKRHETVRCFVYHHITYKQGVKVYYIIKKRGPRECVCLCGSWGNLLKTPLTTILS